MFKLERVVKLSRGELFTAVFLILLVGSTAFFNSVVSKNPLIIHSQGKISYGPKLTVIVRHLGNSMPPWTWNVEQEVDWWVGNHSWIKGGVVLIDVEDVAPILWFNQAGYDGYRFATTEGTWSACDWTFNQLKTLIDRFHYHDVKVVLSIIGFAKPRPDWGSGIWNWINSSHRELLFTRRDDTCYGISGNSYSYPAPLNWFANFTSDDSASGAMAGTRLADLFCTRLEEMINAGLEWDGIFGSEGWGSVGNWGGGAANRWIDASYQLINEWGNASSEFHPAGFPPESWGSRNNIQRADWINANANSYYRGYWGMRYAKFFRQVHDTIESVRSSGWFFGLLFTPDGTWMDQSRSTTWGGWSPCVGYNATYLAEYCAESTFHYAVGNEHCHVGRAYSETSLRELGKYNAYVAASIKSSIPNAHVFPAAMFAFSYKHPMWISKQIYLAQLQNYIWINGTRYRTVDPSWVMMQYPDNTTIRGYFRSIWNEFFDWASLVFNLMEKAEPVYLGPTYIFSSSRTWAGVSTTPPSWGWRWSLNWTTAQWIESNQLENHPENLNWTMGTVFIDRCWLNVEVGELGATEDEILKAFANGSLNVVWYYRHNFISDPLTTKEKNTYHLGNTPSNYQNDGSCTILSDIVDPYGSWIASGYEGTYSFSFTPNWKAPYEGEGFVPISKTTVSDLVQLGIYYNSSSGRLFYGLHWDDLPRAVIHRGLYWVSCSPIIPSEPLLDLKVFKLSNDTILIPMMNVKNLTCSGTSQHYGEPLSSILKINATRLGLGDPTNYLVYVVGSGQTMFPSDWNNVPITLEGMADVLVITPRE